MAQSPLIVVVEQGTATFHRRHLLAGLISWRVNGILLNTAANFSNISAISFAGANGIHTIIMPVCMYHDIRCLQLCSVADLGWFLGFHGTALWA